MKVCLYYFTGTGNTGLVASCLQKEFGDGCEIYQIRYPFQSFPDPNDFDLIGIGYPIHAFNAPEVVNQFFRGFPAAKKPLSYFIFKTSGEPLRFNASSSRLLISRLRKKGYRCVQEFHYVMPYNIMFRHSDPMAKKMWVYAQRMVKHNVKKILSGIVEPPHFRPLQGWYGVLFRIEWPFAKTNGRFFRVDYAKCIHCGKCVSSCSLNNVAMKDGKILFGSNCALCMNCSFYCPRKAITPGLFRHRWLLNGSYHLPQLERDETIVTPSLSHEKHFNKAYDKYFASIDEATKFD